MTNHPNFSIIIPNYNGSKFITNCLQSIYFSIKKCHLSKFEIIIVDNGSTDNSFHLIKSFFQKNKLTNLQFTIYHLPCNMGFAYAVNQGIQISKHPYVVLVNNDLTLKINWFTLISQIINQNTNPKIAAFFGTILNQQGNKYESQGLKFFPSGKCLNVSNGKKFLRSTTKLRSTKLIWGGSGALIVYQKDILQYIGGFDSDFFAYLEDTDVALRLNKFSYQTLYIPQAISYHLGGGTSNHMNNFRYRMDVRNWFYIIIKNYSTKDFWINFFPIIIERCRNLSGLIKNTISIYKYKSILILPRDIFKTYFQILINLPKMRQKYYQTQKLLKLVKQ